MQTRIEESIERVRAFVGDQKPATVGKLAGLSAGALRFMFSNDWNPRATTLWAVETLIDVPEQPKTEKNHGFTTDDHPAA